MKGSLAIKQPPVPEGVDPKSVLCAFFKAGVCERGAKCKFGHDLTLARKSGKASIYAVEEKKKEETMEDWDQAKLEEVVERKEGGHKGNATDIVCQCVRKRLGAAARARAAAAAAPPSLTSRAPPSLPRPSQVLSRRHRKGAVWLFLGVPQWRQGVQVPPLPAAGLCVQEQKGARR